MAKTVVESTKERVHECSLHRIWSVNVANVARTFINSGGESKFKSSIWTRRVDAWQT